MTCKVSVVLTGRLRSVDLYDTGREASQPIPSAMSRPSDPVDNGLDVIRCGSVAQSHDRALAELLFDLAQRGGKCFFCGCLPSAGFLEKLTDGRAELPRVPDDFSMAQLSHKQFAAAPFVLLSLSFFQAFVHFRTQ